MTAEPVPNMPTADLTDDMLFRIETGETVTYGELKRRLAAAQGSESGGEAWRVENDGQTVKFWVGNQGFTVASLEGDDDEPGYLPLMEKLLKKALAALSQPGPASEGDGE